MLLHYKQLGSGPEQVIIMHDWSCDSSSYDPIIPYLNLKDYTYIFVDLRGYGGSKNIKGKYTAAEAANDIINLADHLQFTEFHLIGHSMTGMIAQFIVIHHPKRIKSVIGLTPVPACGSPVDDDTKNFMIQAARGNIEFAQQIIKLMTSDRYCDTFIQWKIQTWFEKSIAEAREAYLNMFCDTDFATKVKGITIPIYVLSGKYDFTGYSNEMMEEKFGNYYLNCEIGVIEGSGHYPMLETPVLLVSLIEKFLNKITKK